MLRTSRLKVTELNPNLTCILCGGYFIDATTIVECLHSFCKSCIVKYLDTSKFCPICDVQVHKTKPLLHIRSDKTLQDIVYKLVPKAFIDEMRRRKEFYQRHPDAGRLTSPEDRGECVEQRVIYDPDENISLSLEYGYGTNQRPETEEIGTNVEKEPVSDEKDSSRRFLLCKAAVRVAHLKKLINMKFDLTPSFEVDIMYLEESLEDDLALMDIAYIYSWRRIGPMRLFYRIRRKAKVVVKALPKCSEEVVRETEKNDNITTDIVPVQNEETPMEVEETITAPPPPPPAPVPVPTPPVTVSASTSTEPKPSKSNKRSAPTSTATIQTVTIVPPVNPASVSGAKNGDSLDQSGQSEPRTKRLCLKVAVSDPSKSPSNSHSPSASVTFASPLSSPSACSSTTSESSSSTGKSSKHKHKSKDKDKEGKSKESKHHKHKESSSKELLRIKEYLKAQEQGTKVKDKNREGKDRSKEHHHHHHHHKSKDGTKGKSSSKTKEPKIKEAIPKFKMATKLKDMPKLTQTVKIKDMPEIRPVEKEVVVAKEPPIKIKEILKNKDAKYKEVYTFTQNPQKSKELSSKSKDYVKFREFPKSSKIKEKKKDKSHKQRRSSLAGLTIPTEITVTKTFVPPVETIPPAPTSPAQVQIVETEPPRREEPEIVEKSVEENAPNQNQPSSNGNDSCKIKVATLVIPGFTTNKPTSPKSLPTSPLYSSLAAPERVQIPDTATTPKEVPKRPASTPAAIGPLPDVEVTHKPKPTEEQEETPKMDKDDDAEMPDEADSGRGSDFSSRTEVRSSCDDDIGSPSPTASFATPPASVSDLAALSTPPVTITVTKTITPPVVETLPATPTVKEIARERQIENAAKNEALSRKAVVEVKKVDDVRTIVEKGKEKTKSFNPFIKTYSKASYVSKDNAVKVANTGSPCHSIGTNKTPSSPAAVETKNSVENIRINLENNKIEKGAPENKTADAIKSPTLPEISKTNVASEKKVEVSKKTSSANNNGGNNNNSGGKADEPKKVEIQSKCGNKEPPKTITISIKTPSCPTIQNRVDDKNVRSPPPPVPSPKLPEPPVAAVGNPASAPSASPPTTATFLQPSLHLSATQPRNNPTSPQYQIFNPNKGHFSPPLRGDQLGKISSKGSKTGAHSPHHHHHHHHSHQSAILPIIVRQNSPHHYTKTANVDRKRKECAPSTSTATCASVREPTKDDIGALDLSVAPRHDRPASGNPSRARHVMVANPPVLDKHRIATCLQAPKINFASGSATQTNPSTSSLNIPVSTAVSIAPSSSTSASSNLTRRSSSDASRIYHRAGVKNLTVINQPGDSPKIVIKNIPLPLDNNRKSSEYGGQHGHQLHMGNHHRST